MENIIYNSSVVMHILLNVPPINLTNAILFIGKKGRLVSKSDLFRKWYTRRWLSPFFMNRVKLIHTTGYISYNANDPGSAYTMLPKIKGFSSAGCQYRFTKYQGHPDTDKETYISITTTRSNKLKFDTLIPTSNYKLQFGNRDISEKYIVFLAKIGKEWWFTNNGYQACKDFENTLILHEAWISKPWVEEHGILG